MRSAPALPEPLRVATVGLAGHDYFVLQFHGPLRPSDRQWIESLGGEILDYVPDFALLVRMGPAARTALGENDRVLQALSRRYAGIFDVLHKTPGPDACFTAK